MEIKLLLLLISFCNGENIVFFNSCSSFSHRLVHWPLVEALASKGHNLTFIGPIGPSVLSKHSEVKEIQPISTVALMQQMLGDNLDVDLRSKGLVPPLFLLNDYFCYAICASFMASEEMKQWIESKPEVDLIVSDFSPECGYGLLQALTNGTGRKTQTTNGTKEIKHILYVPVPMATKHFEPFGLVPESGSIPDYDVSAPVPLNFFNRLTGALLPLWYRVIGSLFYRYGFKPMFEKELGLDPKNQLEFDEALELTNLLIINGDYITDYSRAFPPFVVKVSGIHIRGEDKLIPLDNGVEDFINNGNKSLGLVYISFGTVAKAPSLPAELRQKFFKAIVSFPNLKFIWKWDGEQPKIESLPPNLYLVKWIDQQNILAHPRMLMFLTQAGRPSVQEALDKGLPLITFPILADQDFNADRMVNLGIAIGLDFVGLTEEKLISAISTILEDKSYKSRAVRLSQMSRDVPLSPVDTALFWVEFVLRYTPRELDLLKPLSRQLTFVQKRELDVWLLLTAIAFIFLYAAFVICRRLLANLKLWRKHGKSQKIKTN